MRRIALVVALLAPACIPVYAQTAPEKAQAPASSALAANAPSQPVMDAEALIVRSDWKGAEGKLTVWLADHAADARALFDAGYVADALNKLDEAAGFYRRSVEADPNRFEAHLSLGLLLARQGKLAEARPELAAATTLDPGEAGPAAKARAWRALAQIDDHDNPTEASSDLLEALKLSPETPQDTLLAAELAEKSGQDDAAEAAFRRLLAGDPNNAAEMGEHPFPDGYRLLDPARIYHVHLRDYAHTADGKVEWRAVGEGEFDNLGQIRALLKTGYKDHFTLETHWRSPKGKAYATRTSLTALLKVIEKV